MLAGVYGILNLVTGRRYIGSSRHITRRWREHLSALERGMHINAALQADWRRHGTMAFAWQVIEVIDGPKLARIAGEQRHLDATANPYNAARRAGSGPRDGFKHRPESIAKMKLVAIGKRDKSPETRAKIAASRRGMKLSAEHRAKIGLARVGRKHRPESIARIKAAMDQRPVTWGSAISAGKKGKPWSPARRAAHEQKKTA